MMIRKGTLLILGCLFLGSGCAHQRYVFDHRPVLREVSDTGGSPVPETTGFNSKEYLIGTSVRLPLVDMMDFRRTPRSLDVNAMDDVPRSTWFTPRLGYEKMTSAQLLKGPVKEGPPQKPFTILKTKTKGSAPGFIIRDARGLKYLIKFDSIDFPGVESTVNLVMNRLFWGFGYNVPEDFIVDLDREDLKWDASSGLDDLAVEKVLMFSSADENNRYRATASLFVPGDILGHVSQTGVREGDPYDTIPHEDLRIMRALYVFCALTQQTGIRSDNTLDVYQGNPGQGHTVHYLLDFGEALGVHGLNYGRRWEGFQHYFSWQEFVGNMPGLGIKVKPWEKIQGDASDPRVYFETRQFDPEDWKEVWQFMPMRKSQPDDNYWAAKIISAVTEEQLRGLFNAAAYPDGETVDYWIRTLLARRDKILKDVYSKVTPLESSGVENGSLRLESTAGRMSPSGYEVKFYDRGTRQVAASQKLGSQAAGFDVRLPKTSSDYLRVEINALHSGGESRPAEFHLIRQGGDFELAGVVH